MNIHKEGFKLKSNKKNFYSFFTMFIKLGIFSIVLAFVATAKLPLKPVNLPLLIQTSPNRDGKPRIRIPVLINFAGNLGSGSLYTEGIRIGLETIEQQQLLPKYDLEFEMFDSQCTRHLPAQILVQNITKSLEKGTINGTTMLQFLVGPVCKGSLVIAEIIQYFNMISMTGFADVPELAQKQMTKFKNFYVMLPQSESHYRSIPQFVKANGWQKVHYISHSESGFDRWDDVFVENCKQANISIGTFVKLLVKPDETTTGPSLAEIEEAVIKLKKEEARVIVSSSHWGAPISCNFMGSTVLGLSSFKVDS